MKPAGFLMIKNKKYMTQKEELEGLTESFNKIGCYDEEYCHAARNLAVMFGNLIIDEQFEYWVGPVDCESAIFTNSSFTTEEMRFVLCNLRHWVEKYGSLLGVKCAVKDWWDYTTETGEVRNINLFSWMRGLRPERRQGDGEL